MLCFSTNAQHLFYKFSTKKDFWKVKEREDHVQGRIQGDRALRVQMLRIVGRKLIKIERFYVTRLIILLRTA